jgi:Ras GTPase-activating-like protein IQGAP2/3
VLLQARAKGMLARLEFSGRKGWLAAEEENIIGLQSRIRGYLIRLTHDEKARHYRENMDKVIKIQSLVRAKQQGEAYKSLSTPLLPPCLFSTDVD